MASAVPGEAGDAAPSTGTAAASVAPAEVNQWGQVNASVQPSLSSGDFSCSSAVGPVSGYWNYTSESAAQIGVSTDSSNYYDPQRDVSVPGDSQALPNSSGAMSTTQDHTAYASYQYPVQHGYTSVDYSQYYYNYPQSTYSSTTQQGAHQNSGAAYQNFSSFPNSGSHAGPTSNLDSYYNASGHQSAAGYDSHSYYQTNYWNVASTGSNQVQPYQSYAPADPTSVQSSTVPPANSYQYPQNFQWQYYNNQFVPNSSGTPAAGTMPGAQATISNVGAVYGYSYTTAQPPPPGTTHWRSGSSVSLPQMQEVKQSGHQDQQQVVPHTQAHTSFSPLPATNHEGQQWTPNVQTLKTPSANHSYSNLQTPSHFPITDDTQRVSKFQIPTNPRIAPGLPSALSKEEKKVNEADSAIRQPAFVSVTVPKKDSSQESKAFPPSLRTYVERSFARCKNEEQRSANTRLLTEITTKANIDGTLHTKNWDMEPLFPLPNNTSEMNNLKDVTPTFRRSPSRRSKSRWEPVAEEKPVEKVYSALNDASKVINDSSSIAAAKRLDGTSLNFVKFVPSQPKTPISQVQAPAIKSGQRPTKKQRFGANTAKVENGEASSDSDPEQGLTKYYASAVSLGDSAEEKKRREHRSKRFEKNHGSESQFKKAAGKAGAVNFHARRIASISLLRSYEDGSSQAVEDIDWDALTVKGTCQEIEKRYLRLTSAPDPSTVRPEDVLVKALHMVEISEKNYLYRCDQLKSIRQDLTVQRIQNELTVKVYETHARLALQAGDLPEYNQCQSQLKRLYAEGIKGSHLEFAAYNLLCVILHSNNKRELSSLMASLDKEEKRDHAVKHALDVHSAVSSGNYVLFFRLYKSAPNLNTCLMDLTVEKVRFEAVKCMSKSYRPTVPVKYIARILGFLQAEIEEEGNRLDECEEWLKAHGAVLTFETNGESQLETKSSAVSLHMPEPDNAVAHGDASLAVDDFLTRAP